MSEKKTIHHVTYDLLRTLGLTTVFGNPGSTEQSFLRDFPEDFTYVLGLQEASVLAMADGFAQARRKPALVNLHTAAGTGNAMGSLVASYKANTPLIITAGNQTREMALVDPYLNNREATEFPKPWVKWSYEPARAEDVPAAIMQAYAVAMQPPMGPVFVSIPLDDWDKPALGPAVVRDVSTRIAPDADRLKSFADRISRAERPLLLLGPEVDRDGGWDAGIAFAEKLKAPVFGSSLPDRISFPETHPLAQGPLPMTIAGVHDALKGYDLVIAVGAQVFRYYPYVGGDWIPEGTDVLQITTDPHLSAVAPVGDSLIGSVRTALEQLVDLVEVPADRSAPTPRQLPSATMPEPTAAPMKPELVYQVIAAVKPENAALVNESTSTMAHQLKWCPTTQSDSFFATPSGGIGWGVPAAVGVALGDRERGVKRHVVATIGDGSFEYSVQAIWTAGQHQLPVIFVVFRNGAYEILKSFALLEKTPNVPGLDLPDLDIEALGKGFGLRAVTVDGTESLAKEFTAALDADGPTVIVVHTEPELPFLG
ncbi:benzoylformate decarboxylase [Mycolicibacterium sp. P1-18]|uniref:benzoylformate decarboxylase n=1 Tax=Mycolicibacterium sp. P1-18 TaxID=2024615 RepID=UPI0011F2F3D5|nr:benzoylformate decarboxylase [Mycolicibacterium sp. P1-18]KAA0099471.1 benzoylformate decarboxylase [Mycolicibacterium sp. P1-18]